MTHFDAALYGQGSLAVGAYVAFLDAADIGDLVIAGLVIPVCIDKMCVLFISPTNEVYESSHARDCITECAFTAW